MSKENVGQSTEVDGQATRVYKLDKDVHLTTRAGDLVSLNHLVGWATGGVFHGLTVSWTGETWLGCVKIVKGKKPLVAFWVGDSYTDVLLSLGECLKGGYLYWKEDKWPSGGAKSLVSGGARGGRM